jgi:hypothetical protein
MLPDSDNRPALGLKYEIGAAIPFHCRLDLVPPPLGVCLGPVDMLLAPMPETSVDEDGNMRSGENQISAAPQTRNNLCIYPESEALSMQSRT